MPLAHISGRDRKKATQELENLKNVFFKKTKTKAITLEKLIEQNKQQENAIKKLK